jgi:hypothetical protein
MLLPSIMFIVRRTWHPETCKTTREDDNTELTLAKTLVIPKDSLPGITDFLNKGISHGNTAIHLQGTNIHCQP